MTNKNNAPLFQKLSQQKKIEAFSFHVPGHKNGEILADEAKAFFQPLLQLDSTELSGLDDLHDPQGVIAQAEGLAAEFYQARRTFFLVGGSTVGNLAMILATCKKGDTVLVQRNCHKSILNGCRLAKVNTVFLAPTLDESTGLSIGITKEIVEEALLEFPNVKAIIFTYPSYFGIAHDIKPIIELAHSYKIPVLVDEAHGAHFRLGEPFPKSALDLGADIVVQSAHKTLPAMTMASFLHVNEKSKVRESDVGHYLQMLQSSSPSYPLLVSLDLAREYISSLTKIDIEEIQKDIIDFRDLLDHIPQWNVVKEKQNYKIDPLKIILQTNCDFTGIQLMNRLEKKGIFIELADENFMLLVMPLAPFKRGREFIQLVQEELKDIPITKAHKIEHNLNISSNSILALTYDEMDTAHKVRVVLEEAVGKIAAEQLIPYPPGIPLIMEGEYITKDMTNQIKIMIEAGIRFQGHSNLQEKGILIFE